MQNSSVPCWSCSMSDGFYNPEISNRDKAGYHLNSDKCLTIVLDSEDGESYRPKMRLARSMKTEPLVDGRWISTLSHGLYNAWERQLFTDLVIKTQDEVIHAHKIVLASASPYFSVMLTGGLLEGRTQTLVLEDIPGELIKVVLTYIYTGQAILTEHNADEILTLADYFQLHALRKLCCFQIGRNMTLENCLHVYELAKLHRCFDLASEALALATSRCNDVLESPNFLNIQPDTLITLFEQSYLRIDSEEELLQAIIVWVSDSPDTRGKWLAKMISKIKLDLITTDFKLKSLETLGERKLLTRDVKDIVVSSCTVQDCAYREKLKNDHVEEVLLVMGGEANGRLMRNIECFAMGFTSWQCSISGVALKTENNHTDKTIVLPVMNDARAYCAVASNNNLVYIIGGQTNNSFLTTMERYDVRKNRWEELSSLPEAIHGSAASFLDDSLYVAGGKTSVQHENRLWAYDVKKDTWAAKTPMNLSRVHHGIATVHGSVYAVGGVGPLGPNHQVHTSCEKYDPGSDTWMPIASLSQARAYLGVAVINDYLYAVGGYNGIYWLNSVERYDPLQDQWTMVCSMVSPRSSFGITVSRGRIYCIGGFSGESNLNTVENYNPTTDTWHCVQSMQLRRYGGVAATVLVPFLAKPNP